MRGAEVGVAGVEAESVDDDVVLVDDGEDVGAVVHVGAVEHVGADAGGRLALVASGGVSVGVGGGEGAVEAHVAHGAQGGGARLGAEVAAGAGGVDGAFLDEYLHVAVVRAVEVVVGGGLVAALYEVLLEVDDGVGHVAGGFSPRHAHLVAFRVVVPSGALLSVLLSHDLSLGVDEDGGYEVALTALQGSYECVLEVAGGVGQCAAGADGLEVPAHGVDVGMCV